jgi:hypothetical protein
LCFSFLSSHFFLPSLPRPHADSPPPNHRGDARPRRGDLRGDVARCAGGRCAAARVGRPAARGGGRALPPARRGGAGHAGRELRAWKGCCFFFASGQLWLCWDVLDCGLFFLSGCMALNLLDWVAFGSHTKCTESMCFSLSLSLSLCFSCFPWRSLTTVFSGGGARGRPAQHVL